MTEKYTLTVWIDFEEDNLILAQDLAQEIEKLVTAIGNNLGVTAVESELAPVDTTTATG